MQRIHSVAIRIFVSRKQARRLQTPNVSIGVIWRQYLLPAFTNAKLFHWRYLASISTQWCESARLNSDVGHQVNVFKNGANQRARIQTSTTILPPTESKVKKKL